MNDIIKFENGSVSMCDEGQPINWLNDFDSSGIEKHFILKFSWKSLTLSVHTSIKVSGMISENKILRMKEKNINHLLLK